MIIRWCLVSVFVTLSAVTDFNLLNHVCFGSRENNSRCKRDGLVKIWYRSFFYVTGYTAIVVKLGVSCSTLGRSRDSQRSPGHVIDECTLKYMVTNVWSCSHTLIIQLYSEVLLRIFPQ